MYTESELKKHLNSGHFSKIYLCFGEEKMLVKRSVELIEKKIVGADRNEFNYHIFDGGSDLSDIFVCAGIVPFVSDVNVVRINDMDVDNLEKEDFEDLMKILGSVCDGTVIILAMPTLVLTSSTAKAQAKKLISFCDKYGVCIELTHRTGLALERDLCKWAKMGGCTMSELTAHKLIQYVGEDLNRLNSELKKLTAYADGGEITPEMIDRLVTKSADASVYDLFGFIVSKNTDKALTALSILFYQHIDAIYICTVLAGAYMDAYRARVGAEAGKSPAEVGEDFEYKKRSWVLKKMIQMIRPLNTDALRRSLDEILEAQTRLVTLSIDPQTEIESLVCKLILIAEDN